MTKKIIAIFLCLMILLPLLAACTNAPNDITDFVTEDTAPSAKDPVQTPKPSESSPRTVSLAKNGKAIYQVVWDDALSATGQQDLYAMFDRLKKNSHIEFTLSNDIECRLGSKQILIGEIDCTETTYAQTELQSDEFMISYHPETDRVLILGVNEAKTLEGVQYFLDTYASPQQWSLLIPEDLFYISEGAFDYPIQYLLIDGISILRHTIIIPKNYDISTYYAAQNLADYLSLQMGGIAPQIKTDDTPEQPYEILIGNTNRAESDLPRSPEGEGEYVLMKNGTKVIMQGVGIYVGAANAELITEYLCGTELNRGVRINDLTTVSVPMPYTFTETHTSSILMIGDGMGFNHIEAALANGLDHFVANELPAYGKAITQSQSVINGSASYTDSAASGTALSSGYKTLNGYIGKDSSGKTYKNIRELAQENGAKTAVVTTDVLTGATPAAFLCHNISRKNTSQLQNEIYTLQSQKKVDYLAGSVGNGLTAKTREALLTISNSSANFFLMVEEGYIDKNSHNGKMKETIDCVTRFNDAIAYVIQFVFCHPDTALIITADHETGGLMADKSNSYQYCYTSDNHTNADVPVYAFGAGTEIFNGKRVDNTEIPQFLAKAFGDGKIGKAA